MKAQRIKLSKAEAATIGRLCLIECIAERPGIWTHLNKSLRSPKQVRRARRERVSTARI